MWSSRADSCGPAGGCVLCVGGVSSAGGITRLHTYPISLLSLLAALLLPLRATARHQPFATIGAASDMSN
jgi:hypothetical protein